MYISPLGALPELKHPQIRASIRSRQTIADDMPSSVTAHKRTRQMMDEDFQHAVFLREPKLEPDMDAVPYSAAASSCQNAQVGIISHLHNTSFLGSADPVALPPPNQNPSNISGAKDGTIRHCRSTAASTSFVEPMNCMMEEPQNLESALDHTAVMHNTGTGYAFERTQEAPCLHTVVASSTMGEVNMSITCSIEPSKFCMPDLEAVFKMVEDKFLRSYKILPPNFSVGSLINEICQCVAQLGNDHSAEYNIQSDAFDNGRNSQNESMTTSAPFEESISCMNTGSGKYKAAEE
uniref:Uncharacterized protein n=1 Tax=Arundo donax TaxID=35708 RepID=A0A0A9GZV8_ARUDO